MLSILFTYLMPVKIIAQNYTLRFHRESTAREYSQSAIHNKEHNKQGCFRLGIKKGLNLSKLSDVGSDRNII